MLRTASDKASVASQASLLPHQTIRSTSKGAIARLSKPALHAVSPHSLCALADAYATALNVMGPEQGLALAEELQLPVLMLVREGEGLTELRSSHFPELQPRSDTAVKGSPGLNPMNTGETP